MTLTLPGSASQQPSRGNIHQIKPPSRNSIPEDARAIHTSPNSSRLRHFFTLLKSLPPLRETINDCQAIRNVAGASPTHLEIAIMDIVQGYAIQALHIYNTADPYLRPIRRFIYQTQRQVYPILLPYLNTVADLAHKSPAIITVGILLLFLLIAMQVLNFIRRIMVWWFKLVMRIAFWTVVVLVISAIWQRGVERTVGDLVGWGQELSEVWWREYRRWEGYQNQGRRNQGPVLGRTSARAGWR